MKTLGYIGLFLGAVYKIYQSFDYKISFDSCIGITAMLIAVLALILAYSIRAFGWFIKYFVKIDKQY